MIKEEIKHIMREFYRLKSPKDAAMMFVTQDEVELDDLMSFDYQSKKYYRDVWEYITLYSIDKIRSGKYEQVLVDILPKIELEEYKVTQDKFCYNRNFLISSYLLCLFKELIENGLFNEYAYTLSLLQIQGIDNNLIADIIMQDYSLMSPNQVIVYIDLGIFNPISFCRLLSVCKERYDYVWIDRLIELYISESDRLINIFLYLCEIVEYKIYDRKNKMEIKTRINISSKDRELYLHIYNYIGKRIVLDANIMYLEMLNKCIEEYENEKPKNLFILNAYKDYATWCTDTISKDDNIASLSNYLNYNGEEGDIFPDEFYQAFRYEVLHMNDIAEIINSDDYNFFLKMFNMNRFRFYSEYNEEVIDKMFVRLEDDENKLLLAETALSKDTYVALNLSCYPYI